MTNKINQLLEGKTFEQLKEIYEGFTEKEMNHKIEGMILDAMVEADYEKFLAWSEEL